MVGEKRLKTQGTGTFDIEKLSLEQQKEITFLPKCCTEKLKMRENIRCCIS